MSKTTSDIKQPETTNAKEQLQSKQLTQALTELKADDLAKLDLLAELAISEHLEQNPCSGKWENENITLLHTVQSILRAHRQRVD